MKVTEAEDGTLSLTGISREEARHLVRALARVGDDIQGWVTDDEDEDEDDEDADVLPTVDAAYNELYASLKGVG